MMENAGANGQIINIGNPVEHTILQTAELFWAKMSMLQRKSEDY